MRDSKSAPLDDVRRLLRQCLAVADSVDHVIRQIEGHIESYERAKQRRRGTPQGNALRRWSPNAVARLKRTRQWILKNPIPGEPQHTPNPTGNTFEQLAWEWVFAAA